MIANKLAARIRIHFHKFLAVLLGSAVDMNFVFTKPGFHDQYNIVKSIKHNYLQSDDVICLKMNSNS